MLKLRRAMNLSKRTPLKTDRLTNAPFSFRPSVNYLRTQQRLGTKPAISGKANP